VLLVRNTLTDAAAEGARYAATADRSPDDGAAHTRDQIADALTGRFADGVSARMVTIDGAPAVEVSVHVVVPALGIGGPAISLDVSGHAIEESP
ncbi:MAG: pilus assembly protein, partial [Nocardioides sp.]